MIRLYFLLGLAALVATAQDWPQWRGPARDGVSGVTGPAKWPVKLADPKWKIKVGVGHSSPVFVAGRIYSLAREGEQEVVRAVDAANGKVVWQQSYVAPYEMNGAAISHGKGPKSTPVVSDGRLFTFGISGILTAWDAGSGKKLWDVRPAKPSDGSPLFGTAMSPVVFEGMVVAHSGNDSEGAMTAYEVATGKVKWTWKGDGPAYSSPVVTQVGSDAVLVTHSKDNFIALNARSGDLLWKLPFKTPYTQNSVTPAVRGDQVIYSGLENGVTAIRMAKKGSQWTTTKVWQTSEVSMYMNSPVWKGNLLCGLSHKNKGQYFCLDSASGKVAWTSPGRQAENAALLLAGSTLVALEEDGELVLMGADGSAYRLDKRYPAAQSATWAHPVLVPGGIVIKDFDSLSFIPL